MKRQQERGGVDMQHISRDKIKLGDVDDNYASYKKKSEECFQIMYNHFLANDIRAEIIYVDPPYSYMNQSRKRSKTANGDEDESRGFGITGYPTMTSEDLMKYPVAKIAAPNCALLMWASGATMATAIDTMRAWGFEYVTVWKNWSKINARKLTPKTGWGWWSRNSYEYILVGKRQKKAGKMITAWRQWTTETQVFETDFEGGDEHVSPAAKLSAKPAQLRERIERYFGPRVRLELFAWPDAQQLENGYFDGWHISGFEVPGMFRPAKSPYSKLLPNSEFEDKQEYLDSAFESEKKRQAADLASSSSDGDTVTTRKRIAATPKLSEDDEDDGYGSFH